MHAYLSRLTCRFQQDATIYQEGGGKLAGFSRMQLFITREVVKQGKIGAYGGHLYPDIIYLNH